MAQILTDEQNRMRYFRDRKLERRTYIGIRHIEQRT